MAREGCPAEFGQRVLKPVASGRKVVDVARDLGVTEQTIYSWRREERMDQGDEAGLTIGARAELLAAKRRIKELETELKIHRRSTAARARNSLLGPSLAARRVEELDRIIADEGLGSTATYGFVAAAQRDGIMQSAGTPITVLTPVSRFLAGEAHAAEKRAVLERLAAFLERFLGPS